MTEQLGEEAKRRLRVLDTMLSSHSLLRDRYAFRSTVMDLVLLAVSIVLVAATFADPRLLNRIGIDAAAAHVVFGVASLAAFFFSLVQWRVDWKERAGEHRRACGTLARLKARFRALRDELAEGSEDALTKARQWFEDMDGAMDGLPPIPDKQFNSLKAKHLRKVEVSRLLDSHPGAWLPLVRAKIWWHDTKRIVRASMEKR